jgi:hypothetical protein
MNDSQSATRKIYAVRRGVVASVKRPELRIEYDPCDLFSAPPTFHSSFAAALDEALGFAVEEAAERGDKVETWVVVRGPSSTMLTVYQPIAIELGPINVEVAQGYIIKAPTAPAPADSTTQEAPGGHVPHAEPKP